MSSERTATGFPAAAAGPVLILGVLLLSALMPVLQAIIYGTEWFGVSERGISPAAAASGAGVVAGAVVPVLAGALGAHLLDAGRRWPAVGVALAGALLALAAAIAVFGPTAGRIAGAPDPSISMPAASLGDVTEKLPFALVFPTGWPAIALLTAGVMARIPLGLPRRSSAGATAASRTTTDPATSQQPPAAEAGASRELPAGGAGSGRPARTAGAGASRELPADGAGSRRTAGAGASRELPAGGAGSRPTRTDGAGASRELPAGGAGKGRTAGVGASRELPAGRAGSGRTAGVGASRELTAGGAGSGAARTGVLAALGAFAALVPAGAAFVSSGARVGASANPAGTAGGLAGMTLVPAALAYAFAAATRDRGAARVAAVPAVLFATATTFFALASVTERSGGNAFAEGVERAAAWPGAWPLEAAVLVALAARATSRATSRARPGGAAAGSRRP